MAGKVYVDDTAAAIIAKYRDRLPEGWEPTPSNIIRYLDSVAVAHDQVMREAAAGRRLRSRT